MDIDALKQETIDLYGQLHAVEAAYMDLWMKYQFLTWRWWVTVALAVVPWIVWLFVRKKDSACRLLLVYFFVASLASVSDMLGTTYRLWSYPVVLFPYMSCVTVFDLSVLPVTTMLFIQFAPKVKPVYKALVYAATGSFIFQPIIEAIGIVVHEKWPIYFSFPILFAIYYISHAFAVSTKYEPII